WDSVSGGGCSRTRTQTTIRSRSASGALTAIKPFSAGLQKCKYLAFARLVRQALQRVDEGLFHAALGTLDVAAGERQGIVALDLGDEEAKFLRCQRRAQGLFILLHGAQGRGVRDAGAFGHLGEIRA